MKTLLLLLLVVCAATAYRVHHHNHFYGSEDHHDSSSSSSESHHSDDDSHHDDSHHSDSDSHDDDHHDDDHHIYRFAFGHEHGAYGYQDSHGTYHGLWPDILRAVCKHAHKECRWILDRYDHCWTQDEHYAHYEYPGIGLLDHYYDACFGWMDTHERRNAFNFSKPMHPPSTIAVIVDEKKFEGDQHQLTGKTSGHVRGWQNMAECFDHQDTFQGHHEGEYKVHNYDTLHDVIEALHKGEVDFMVVPTDALDTSHEHLHIVEPTFKCSDHGYGLMANYGNHVLDWWDHYFHEVFEDGTLERICENAKHKYAEHGPVHCFHH